MVHEEYKEMIPARALSALDAAEAQALNEHLENCAECRKELEEWQTTAATLALTADTLEPSPAVRERILSEVRNDLSSPPGITVQIHTSEHLELFRFVGRDGSSRAAYRFDCWPGCSVATKPIDAR